MKRGLINADAIFQEHLSRTGKSHSAWRDCKFLLDKISEVDFETKIWKRWYRTLNGKSNGVTKPKDLELRKAWCKKHARGIRRADRNLCEMTEPPQCINEKEFPGCRDDDLVTAYRKYYLAKMDSISGGMRYFYTKPPLWLPTEKVHLERKQKGKRTQKVNQSTFRFQRKRTFDLTTSNLYFPRLTRRKMNIIHVFKPFYDFQPVIKLIEMTAFIVYFDNGTHSTIPSAKDFEVFFASKMTTEPTGFLFAIEETATRHRETFGIAIRDHRFGQPTMREFQFCRPFKSRNSHRTYRYYFWYGRVSRKKDVRRVSVGPQYRSTS